MIIPVKSPSTATEKCILILYIYSYISLFKFSAWYDRFYTFIKNVLIVGLRLGTIFFCTQRIKHCASFHINLFITTFTVSCYSSQLCLPTNFKSMEVYCKIWSLIFHHKHMLSKYTCLGRMRAYLHTVNKLM